MKKPYFNREQRSFIYAETLYGAALIFDLETKKLLRAIYIDKGWIIMKREERKINRLLNIELLGHDNPKKWWQIF